MAVSISYFVRSVEELGFEVVCEENFVTVYYIYGPKLRSKCRVARISLVGDFSYQMFDVMFPDKRDLADLVHELGCSSKSERGRMKPMKVTHRDRGSYDDEK